MKLDEILQAAGRHKRRRRVGRGNGSGHGKTSGRGHRGYHQRAGSGRLFGFEGGQNPMLARIPQRGFNNANFACRYGIVNVNQLERFADGTRVDPEVLCNCGLLGNADCLVKILGTGQLNRQLTVVAHKFSRSARQKITGAGGTAQDIAKNIA